MKIVLCFAALFVLLMGRVSLAHAEQPRGKPSPEEVLRLLQEGNKRFVSGKPLHPHPHAQTARLLRAGSESQGDYAIATVLGCSDSRVPVELLFDQGVMDLFVVRVAGNVVNTDEAGSIEYGLAHVHTPLLVVLGHSQCGAVTAVVKGMQGETRPWERNIPPLVVHIQPAVQRALAREPELQGDALVAAAIEENIWLGIERLFLSSPSTRELVRSKEAMVVGALYDVGTGLVTWLAQQRVFEILDEVENNPDRAREAMSGS